MFNPPSFADVGDLSFTEKDLGLDPIDPRNLLQIWMKYASQSVHHRRSKRGASPSQSFQRNDSSFLVLLLLPMLASWRGGATVRSPAVDLKDFDTSQELSSQQQQTVQRTLGSRAVQANTHWTEVKYIGLR